MANPETSTAFWHSDGYVEVILIGTQTSEQIRTINQTTFELLDAHGTANILIDARRGRIARDASSFSVITRLSRNAKLKRLYILVDKYSTNPDAGKESGVIISMITAALGKRPLYIYDEEEARQLAAGNR